MKAKTQKRRVHIELQATGGTQCGRQRHEIKLPPAHRLASVLQYLLTKRAYKRTVEPDLVDLYDEYSELIQKGEETRAKWVVLRGHFLIVWRQLRRPIIALAGWFAALKD